MDEEERRFPYPEELETPPGAEGWEEMYPYYFLPNTEIDKEDFYFWIFPIFRNQYRLLTRFHLKAGCVISVSITAGYSSCLLRMDSKGSSSGGISTGHPKRLQI